MPKASNPKPGALHDSWGRLNRKLADRVCANCGTVFRPIRQASRYCSRACTWANNGGHNKKPECWWINGKGYEDKLAESVNYIITFFEKFK
jgi:hypothetical protein